MMAFKSQKQLIHKELPLLAHAEAKTENMEKLLHFLMTEYPDYYYLRGRRVEQLPENTYKEALNTLKSEFLK